MHDCLIIGGGVIGLSLAYELSGAGMKVCLVDRGSPGCETSWAAAGMLPPACSLEGQTPLDALACWSAKLHAGWSADLREVTGIDNGYRRSGALYVTRNDAAANLLTRAAAWKSAHIRCERCDSDRLIEIEPELSRASHGAAAVLVPEECQIRSPRHLKALVSACLARGVEIKPGSAVADFEIRRGRIQAAHTPMGSMHAGQFCITSGCWSGPLAARLGMRLSIKPIRGQIVLLSCPRTPIRHIINEGPRYLVPRPDGRVLVGSTEEDVGFDRRTTAAAVSDLIHFAMDLVPALREAEVERAWAGLRPGTKDGLPYLGKLPDVENGFIAAGHYRNGMLLSTATAVVMSQLIRNEPPQLDLASFRPDRHGR